MKSFNIINNNILTLLLDKEIRDKEIIDTKKKKINA